MSVLRAEALLKHAILAFSVSKKIFKSIRNKETEQSNRFSKAGNKKCYKTKAKLYQYITSLKLLSLFATKAVQFYQAMYQNIFPHLR